MAINVEDAGFEVRDQLMWVYGSGFPKSHNVGLSIDKSLGHPNRGHRISVASRTHPDGTFEPNGEKLIPYETKSEEAKKWEGWGTNLKPAHEPILMARKPFKGSVAKNVLLWNTGGINIDDCRIPIDNNDKIDIRRYESYHDTFNSYEEGVSAKGKKYSVNESHSLGRFPANIFFDEAAGKLLDEQSGKCGNGWKKNYGKSKYKGKQYNSSTNHCIYGGGYTGKNTYSDFGGASRFFYCPKPSTKEREEGLENIESTLKKNTHSTVKPVALMQYLIRLVTPKGGITIDPFAGSGTSPKATIREGNFKFIAIEKEKEYFDIAVARCQYEYEQSTQKAA